MKTFRLPLGFAILSVLAVGPALADVSGSPLVVYELHVWAWKPNSTGHFADNNPYVSCNAAKAQ